MLSQSIKNSKFITFSVIPNSVMMLLLLGDGV